MNIEMIIIIALVHTNSASRVVDKEQGTRFLKLRIECALIKCIDAACDFAIKCRNSLGKGYYKLITRIE